MPTSVTSFTHKSTCASVFTHCTRARVYVRTRLLCGGGGVGGVEDEQRNITKDLQLQRGWASVIRCTIVQSALFDAFETYSLYAHFLLAVVEDLWSLPLLFQIQLSVSTQPNAAVTLNWIYSNAGTNIEHDCQRWQGSPKAMQSACAAVQFERVGICLKHEEDHPTHPTGHSGD